jgi:hypothetical protein
VYKVRNKNGRWLEAILEQLDGEGAGKDDAAQWISYYLCLHHDDVLLAAAISLGLPVVQKMSPHPAHDMWTAASINISQQIIIKRFICEYLGPHVFIPDTELIELVGKKQVEPTFSSYVYVSDEKPKTIEKGDLTKG